MSERSLQALTDDRGREVPRYNPLVRATSGQARAEFSEETLQRVRVSLGSGSSQFHRAAMVVSTGLMLASAATIVWVLGILWPAPLLVTLAVWFWFTDRLGVPAREGRHWRDAMLAEGRCPSCAYPLEGVSSAPDGCTVCPECGAAWRWTPRS